MVNESQLKITEEREVDVVFIDFSKAFDLVCHDILLAKLCKYGVDRGYLNWCRGYLTEGQQRVVVKEEASDRLTVTSGVPRGALLGPFWDHTKKGKGSVTDLGEGPRELGPSLIRGEKRKSQKEEKLTGQGTKNRLSFPLLLKVWIYH